MECKQQLTAKLNLISPQLFSVVEKGYELLKTLTGFSRLVTTDKLRQPWLCVSDATRKYLKIKLATGVQGYQIRIFLLKKEIEGPILSRFSSNSRPRQRWNSHFYVNVMRMTFTFFPLYVNSFLPLAPIQMRVSVIY